MSAARSGTAAGSYKPKAGASSWAVADRIYTARTLRCVLCSFHHESPRGSQEFAPTERATSPSPARARAPAALLWEHLQIDWRSAGARERGPQARPSSARASRRTRRTLALRGHSEPPSLPGQQARAACSAPVRPGSSREHGTTPRAAAPRRLRGLPRRRARAESHAAAHDVPLQQRKPRKRERHHVVADAGADAGADAAADANFVE